jgi:hypothetical protein
MNYDIGTHDFRIRCSRGDLKEMAAHIRAWKGSLTGCSDSAEEEDVEMEALENLARILDNAKVTK